MLDSGVVSGSLDLQMASTEVSPSSIRQKPPVDGKQTCTRTERCRALASHPVRSDEINASS